MKSPIDGRTLEYFDSVESTQDYVVSAVLEGRTDLGGALAGHQTRGRGRHGRKWFSPPGSSLSLSVAFWDYADWERPELLGCAVALAAAEAFDCGVQWPNDVVIAGRKVGGVIVELPQDSAGRRIPVVGVGINLGVEAFPPDVDGDPTSLQSEGHDVPTADAAARAILDALRSVPEPTEWASLRERWGGRDETVGKAYKLPGGKPGIARGISESGWLIVESDGDVVIVPSADAWFGDPRRSRS
ncbi:biotin--[acetyl-CoA-carboxylase] ligase [Fimbriimonadia bacterium ATM]|nr:MAG: biotin--[acetyl-CoA-carboxylase] ligase [Armatimonadota bacterium]MBC6970786.1 biotin--[acetyl-CoA-carboxylase] ligase [Armatimonadota bacterium]MCE7900925.1 biotin--[acetyl-CoA-carboxylase] ligase [Armatimonadetes bacterium ATM1]MDL1929660.1 biotin--[acetyl-CoA-carboxylase] ligase [Fimbriimonadia bacterium ATM]RIJ94820.1 MAG: biotin--[acetyl-CoA-carboxylase] ligase [Armatimonadota bacterium]